MLTALNTNICISHLIGQFDVPLRRDATQGVVGAENPAWILAQV